MSFRDILSSRGAKACLRTLSRHDAWMLKVPRCHRFIAAALPIALLALAGCKETAPATRKVDPLLAEPKVAALKSAEPNSFDEVAARLDRGGSLYFYLSTAQWLAGLSQQVASLRDLAVTAVPGTGDAERAQMVQAFNVATSLIKKSGLEDVTGLGASSIALEPGVHRNTVFAHHPRGGGTGFLWSAFGKAPHRLEALDFLPADTALAAFADLDLAQLIGTVRQEVEQAGIPEAKQTLDLALAQLSTLAGMPVDTVLQSLGGSLGLVLTLDPAKPLELPIPDAKQTIPTPRLAIFLAVKDDRIFKQIETALGASPSLVRVDEAGLQMRTMPMPVMPELTLRATVAQWGNYLVIASDDQLVRDLATAQKSGKGFKSTPEFAKFAQGLPELGNGFQLATQRFSETWNGLQRDLMKNQPVATPGQAALMEKLMAYQKSGAAYSVSAHVENGWLIVGKGSQGASQLALPLIVAPAAIAAGIAMPVFASVKERGTATKSLSNAKQIGLACKLYALDNAGKFPPTLEELVPDYLPEADILISPFAPDQKLGYRYTAGLDDKAPAKTVLLEDQFAGAASFRVVVYTDNSGEAQPVK